VSAPVRAFVDAARHRIVVGFEGARRAPRQEKERPMRYVLMNFVHPDDAAAYYASSAEEQQADVQRHIEWFRRHADHIVGGEELDDPKTVKTLRPGRQGEGVVVTDGPYIETKEIFGGFVIIEAADIDEAIEIASDWPSLSSQPNATVHLQPAFVR
jgi:hypothetical protein